MTFYYASPALNFTVKSRCHLREAKFLVHACRCFRTSKAMLQTTSWKFQHDKAKAMTTWNQMKPYTPLLNWSVPPTFHWKNRDFRRFSLKQIRTAPISRVSTKGQCYFRYASMCDMPCDMPECAMALGSLLLFFVALDFGFLCLFQNEGHSVTHPYIVIPLIF